MSGLSRHLGVLATLALVGVAMVGCSSKSINHAPVEDRGAGTARPAAVVMDSGTSPVKQPPGFENAGKPGYYTVKPGDTLIRIGLDHGQGAKDIARWNSVTNPNLIEVGQVLRIVPPAAVTAGVVAKPVTQASVVPVTAGSAMGTSDKQAATGAASPASATAPVVTSEDDIGWIWPTNGAVLAGFDEVKNKGLDIGGAAGDPVVAAADGKVVYVGAGLRGYGNLIILKHNNTYLTAYAHNKTLLIKEDQSVRKGQKIAEMGNSDADRVKLHFEVRRQGKPVDPAKYLPVR